MPSRRQSIDFMNRFFFYLCTSLTLGLWSMLGGSEMGLWRNISGSMVNGSVAKHFWVYGKTWLTLLLLWLLLLAFFFDSEVAAAAAAKC